MLVSPTYSESPNHHCHRRRRRAARRDGQESAYQVWRSRVGVKLCVHAMLNYRLLPLEDGGNLHLIGDHGVYQFA